MVKMPFGLLTWVGPRKHVLDGAQISLVNGAIVMGKDVSGHARRYFVVSCAKMNCLICCLGYGLGWAQGILC